MTEESRESRGREFLAYVAREEARLKHNLQKNITFDPDLFEDVFQDTVLKVYEAITERGVIPEDIERYFFISSRFNYINEQNRAKKRHEGEGSGMHNSECIIHNQGDLGGKVSGLDIEKVKEEVFTVFKEREAELFFDYFLTKSRGKQTYRGFATAKGLSLGTVSDVCGKIRKHLKERRNGFYTEKEEGL